NEMATPPRPPAPWHPAQLSAYSVSKATTSFGASVSKPFRGCPGGVPQPDSIVRPSAAHRQSDRNDVTVRLHCRVTASIPALPHPRAAPTPRSHALPSASDG